MVVIPAEGDQIVGIGLSAMRPGDDMMDFEPIVERAAVDGAASVTVENMPSQFPAHGAGTAAEIEWFAVLGEADQIDIPVTDDLFEGSRTETWSSQN